MQLENKYYKYAKYLIWWEFKSELAEKIIGLDTGQSFDTQGNLICLIHKTESYGKTLCYNCVYDNAGKLVCNYHF